MAQIGNNFKSITGLTVVFIGYTSFLICLPKLIYSFYTRQILLPLMYICPFLIVVSCRYFRNRKEANDNLKIFSFVRYKIKTILALVIFSVGFLVVIAFLRYALSKIGWNQISHILAWEFKFVKHSKEIISMPIDYIFVRLSFLVPFYEELFFRGTIQKELMKYNKNFAILISSLLFASVHTPLKLPIVFLSGLVHGKIFEITGNIWITYIVHSIGVLFSLILRYNFKQDIEYLQRVDTYTAAQTISLSVIGIISLGFVIYTVKKIILLWQKKKLEEIF